MKSSEYQDLINGAANKKPKANKYNAKKVEDPIHGVFDSIGEYKHFQELRRLQMAGEISDLKRQVSYTINVEGMFICKYTPDFVFKDKSGKTIVQDFKGAYRLPPDVPLRLKLMKAVHGIDVEIVGRKKRSGRGKK